MRNARRCGASHVALFHYRSAGFRPHALYRSLQPNRCGLKPTRLVIVKHVVCISTSLRKPSETGVPRLVRAGVNGSISMIRPSLLESAAATDSSPSNRLPPMTEEEFLAWLPGEQNAEWVNGEVIFMSPAATKHVRITSWLDRVLGTYVEIKKLGELLGPELAVRIEHTGLSRRVPDLLFLCRENLGRLQVNHLEGPPDVAIEIVSLDSTRRDWHEKRQEYEAAGVKEYWIIDPNSETFQALLRMDDGTFAELPLDSDGVFHSPTITDFWLKPAWLWQADLPQVAASLRSLGVID